MTACSDDFGGAPVPRWVDSTPVTGIGEPPARSGLWQGRSGSLSGGSGGLGPGARSQAVRSDPTTGPRRPQWRGMIPPGPGTAARLPEAGREPDGAAPRRDPSRAVARSAGRDPNGTAPPPVGRLARAGTGPRPGRMSDRVGTDGRVGTRPIAVADLSIPRVFGFIPRPGPSGMPFAGVARRDSPRPTAVKRSSWRCHSQASRVVIE